MHCFIRRIVFPTLLIAAASFNAGPSAAQETNKAGTQQKPQSADQVPTVRVGAEEVLLDVVVRDKRGRPVTDLKAEEIEVFEDGVKQKVTSFRHVSADLPAVAGGANSNPTGATGAPGGQPKSAQLDPVRQINLVTMVFERLNNEGRLQARDAAQEFLKTELKQNVMIAVFALDQRLAVLQQFTNDRDRLKAAIDRATGAASSQFAAQSEAIARELETMAKAQGSLESAAGNAQSTGAAGIGQAAVQAKLAEVTTNILRQTDDAQREQQGAASVYSLLGLIRGQQRLAGRKTVLYFSEGLKLTPNLVDAFRNAISAANRANVSFYAVDARGLQTARDTTEARESLSAAARANEQQMRSRGGQAVTPEQVKAFDNAESSILKNAQQNLAALAESTGGFLVANTNDLRSPMRRVSSELSSYYEIYYVPTVREYDGRFHETKVKTSRADVALQTRSGYFALPPAESGGPGLRSFELPLLAALNAATLPRDFEFRATALRFESNSGGTHQTLVLEVPMGNLAFRADEERKVYRAHFALLALVKNVEGAIVQKFSKDQPLEGALATLEGIKQRSYLFENNFSLPPGRYTLEAVAQDRAANKLAARRAVIIVPPPKAGVAMSSVVVIKRTSPPDANAKESPGEFGSPLLFSAGRIIPNLGDVILPTPGAQVSFYFVVYPAASGMSLGQPKLTLEFLLDGEVIARAAPPLSAPDAQGRIPYIAAVPMTTFKGGRYELRAVVQQGAQAVEEHAFFTINQ
jgi:VWFA-related protein